MPIKGLELEDVQSDLQALRKLYGLLQSSGDGVQLTRNEILDERARLLLKNLLDGAAERILETHLKMITAAHSGVSNTSCSAKLEQQPKTMPKLQLPVSSNINILGASASVIPKANNRYSFMREKDSKPTTQEVLYKQISMQLQRQKSSKIGNDQDSSLNINGHEKALVQLKSFQKRIGEIQRNPSIDSSIATGQKFQSKEESNFSKQVADSMQRIALAVGDPIKISEGTSRIGSLSRVSSQNVNACITSQTTSKYVHGLRVPPMSQKETIRKAVKSGPSMLPPTSSVHKKNLPHQIFTRPTLQNHVSPVLYRDRTDKVLPYQRELEDSNSQHSSSTWTTQQTSSSSGREAYSLPTRTRTHRRMGPTSKKFTSTEESSSASYSSQSRDVSPTRTYRSRHQTNPTKAMGHLKRFKNKLGLIFHHHHHHHHHHHGSNDSDHTKSGHTTSVWNNLQKMFHSSNKKQQHEAYGEHAVDKLRKSTFSNVTRKNQVHALVKGLMRHVRHSKKSKASKAKGLGNKKKMVKKLHWWQMFQRHGGVKLPNRGRVKLGFKNKKSHLTAQLR